MSAMTISVLMSVYKSDVPEYLDKAIKSVWTDQTLRPNQIVLVEDGDLGEGLISVIANWKLELGEKLTVLKNEKNIGLTKSLNKGIKYVTSSLIARMDSDDISEPTRFEKQADFLQAHPEVDIVGGALREFNDENPNLRIRHYPETNEEVKKYIVKASPLAHPTVMMRRSIFDNGLCYNEKYRTSQDIALWYDALLKGHKIANIQDITINFRSGGDVYKRRSRSKAWNEFKIYVNGIYRLKGLFTFNYIYPFARLIFRLIPHWVVKRIYGSKIRSKFLG
jgi:glycosyltransferase involved in cell wall biosynthesis